MVENKKVIIGSYHFVFEDEGRKAVMIGLGSMKNLIEKDEPQ